MSVVDAAAADILASNWCHMFPRAQRSQCLHRYSRRQGVLEYMPLLFSQGAVPHLTSCSMPVRLWSARSSRERAAGAVACTDCAVSLQREQETVVQLHLGLNICSRHALWVGGRAALWGAMQVHLHVAVSAHQ